jgi:transcriptional regulator with XRE-family HTH domain
MYEVMILDPQKLKNARGERTQQEIADATEGVFTFQQISQYERGAHYPRPEKIPYLLKALGVEFHQVATYVSLPSDLAA